MNRLESDFTISVVLDKELLFQNFSPSSPSSVFKLLKQFKKSPIIPNNLHWGRKQAVCDGFISKIFSEYFASVSGSLCLTILYLLLLLILISNYRKSTCLRRLSVHVYNSLKTPALLTVFLLLFINVVRRYFLLLLIFFF